MIHKSSCKSQTLILAGFCQTMKIFIWFGLFDNTILLNAPMIISPFYLCLQRCLLIANCWFHTHADFKLTPEQGFGGSESRLWQEIKTVLLVKGWKVDQDLYFNWWRWCNQWCMVDTVIDKWIVKKNGFYHSHQEGDFDVSRKKVKVVVPIEWIQED